MKKLKKNLLTVIVVLIVLIIAVVLIAGAFLDRIVKTGIETVAPKITQTAVTLSSVNISPLSGSAGINGLVIGNPTGFKTTNAISVGKAAVSVEPGSLLSKKIIVRSVEVRAPEITFEGNPFGENNLKQIMDNVNAVAGGGATTNAPAKSEASKSGKKLEVDDLLITGIKVHASITGMEGKEFTLDIPDIHFTDLGKGSGGITAAELTQKILKEVTADTIKAVGDYAKKMAGSTANDLIKGTSSNATKAVDEGASKLKKSIGNLFGK